MASTRTHSASFRNNGLCGLHKGTVGEVLLLPHFTEKKTKVSLPLIPEIMATLIHCFIFLQSTGEGGQRSEPEWCEVMLPPRDTGKSAGEK